MTLNRLENHNFNIVIVANFLIGGKYNYRGKLFHRFFANNSKSLFDYIINNKSVFINYIKSKRDRKNKLCIRKSDNYDFLSDFKINQITKPSNNFTANYDVNHIYFTDCGIITLKEWISLNEENLI